MKEYEFEKTIKMTYPECDMRNQLKLSGIMRHIQEVSGEHLEALHLSHGQLWAEGFVFLLTRVGMRITRKPEALEAIRVVTKPRAPKGVQCMRDVYFYDEAGAELIYAQTAWALTDPIAHKLRRPKELPHEIPLEPVEIDYALVRERLKRPENAQPAGVRCVNYSDIDCNMHMNNAVYADIVCDFLPLKLHRDHDLTEFHIGFVGEVRLGDELTLWRAHQESGGYYIGADRPAGDRCFEAVLKFNG